MFSRSDLLFLDTVSRQKYRILISNCHDVTISSLLTGHEWIIISDYGADTCRILHRHSRSCPFHTQRGTYRSMGAALRYIEGHDRYFASKNAPSRS